MSFANLKVGKWVVETDDESLWRGPTGFCFPTRMAALRAIAAAKKDPLADRDSLEEVETGCFVYTYSGPGVSSFGEHYYIWHITESNILDFEKRLSAAVSDKIKRQPPCH